MNVNSVDNNCCKDNINKLSALLNIVDSWVQEEDF